MHTRGASVTPVDLEQVSEMPGHSDLFLGLLPYHGRNAKLVDTAQVVVPPERLGALELDVEERVSHAVIVDDGRWGLAASAIGEVIELRPDDVKWRNAPGQRPWLAGTVIEHMCALLDVEALVTLLRQGDPEAA